MRKPLVAVPAYPVKPGRIEGWQDSGIAVPTLYVDALKRAGAQEAVLMPEELDDDDASAMLEHFDGLLLLGGGDLGPSTFGQARHEKTYGVIPVRDAFELALCRAAIGNDVPTLAICRGAQLLNVALGGSLDQHITGRPGLIGHGIPRVEHGAQLHDVALEPGSRLAETMGTTRAEVSSHHHQAIDAVGRGLLVTARAADGIVEGLELDGEGWIVGAQWHPEDTAATDPAQQRLFDGFVRAANG